MLATLASVTTAAGLFAGGCAYAALSPESQIFGKTVVAGSDPAEFALTFDDGPNDPWTPRLLELLAQHNVRATFFLIGEFVRERPALVRQIVAAGHLIGNHTATHPWLPLLSNKQVRNQLAFCNATIEEATGQRVHYFRPPHGARRPGVLRAARGLGLTPVLWNAMGYDWRRPPAETIAGHLARGIARNQQRGRGSNLLLHDGGHTGVGADRSRSVEAVRLILAQYPPGATRYITVDAWR
ncbi:MAG TPA: polysaccharide deacetylase family protein [Acidobacteriaceae bacterium]